MEFCCVEIRNKFLCENGCSLILDHTLYDEMYTLGIWLITEQSIFYDKSPNDPNLTQNSKPNLLFFLIKTELKIRMVFQKVVETHLLLFFCFIN